MSTASPTNWAERLSDLGNIPASRIVCSPSPGSATLQDLLMMRDEHGRVCELIGGTLVEKHGLAGLAADWGADSMAQKLSRRMPPWSGLRARRDDSTV